MYDVRRPNNILTKAKPTVNQLADADENQAVRRPMRGQQSVLSALMTQLFQQILALAVCVGIPALVTAIAPVSWIKFERRDGHVAAVAQTCLLFVVPYRTMTVDPVTGFGDRFVEGTVTRQRRTGPDKYTKSEDEGFLVIQGPDQSAEVPVSPASLGSVIERAEAFLQDSRDTELKLFVVANWKFSVIGGGLISLLTVLYVLGVTVGLLAKLLNVFRRALKGSP